VRLAAPLLVILLLLAGCSATTAPLAVDYRAIVARRGPLSTLAPRRVRVADFADTREEIHGIGYRRNIFEGRAGLIETTRPVTEIVRDALAVELARNGHRLSEGAAELVLSGEVGLFWFDAKGQILSSDYMGVVGITLRVSDGGSGAVLLVRNYQGFSLEGGTAGAEETYTRVMNSALSRMVRSVATDRRLVRAFSGRR
jgi:uncharacterized lipoprotein YajG